MSTQLEIGKLHLENADKFGGYAMQAWNFHIISVFAVVGWSITVFGDKKWLDLFPAILIGLGLLAVLMVTGLNALRFTEMSKGAVTHAKASLTNTAGLQLDYLNDYSNWEWKTPITCLVIGIDLLASAVTVMLLSNKFPYSF